MEILYIMSSLPRTTPESVGISSETLIRLMERLKKLDSLNSIMIMRHGKVCLEGWWKPYRQQMPHMLFSLSKSFVSVAIGIAQEENLLNVSDKLIKFFPEYDSVITDDQMRNVTLHHLLSMASGHDGCAKPHMEADPEQEYVRGFLSSKLGFKPGEHFAYNSAATYMLAAIIKKLTGLNVREYLMPRLFIPLGIAPGIWESCPKGTNYGGWGLYLKTEDIAKFANLLLNNGCHEGKQLIPAAYLAKATKMQSDNSMNASPDWKLGYGYQFWISQHGFRGDGASGQYAIVVKEKNLAIATTSCIENMQDILTAFWEELIPYLEDAPLSEQPETHIILRNIMSDLTMPTAKGELNGPAKNQIFEFIPNEAGINSCSVEFGEGECALTFVTDNGLEQLRAGFGSHRISTLKLTDVIPHPTAASAAWISENVLEIQAFCIDGTFRDAYTINFNHPEQPLSRASRCSTFRRALPELKVK